MEPWWPVNVSLRVFCSAYDQIYAFSPEHPANIRHYYENNKINRFYFQRLIYELLHYRNQVHLSPHDYPEVNNTFRVVQLTKFPIDESFYHYNLLLILSQMVEIEEHKLQDLYNSIINIIKINYCSYNKIYPTSFYISWNGSSETTCRCSIKSII